MPTYRRMWAAGTAIVIAVGVVLVIVFARSRRENQPHYLCWDAPPTGRPANYQVRFDGAGSALVTTGECVRLPALPAGNHVADVRAVDKDGRVSPAAVLHFDVK